MIPKYLALMASLAALSFIVSGILFATWDSLPRGRISRLLQGAWIGATVAAIILFLATIVTSAVLGLRYGLGY